MTHNTEPRLRRRTVLSAVGASAVAFSTAGCLDGVLGGDTGAHENVVLEIPDNYDDMRERRDEGIVEYPIHGDELPEVSGPDASDCCGEEVVDTAAFIGEKHSVYTFIFTRCPTACPVLTSTLAHAQVDSLEHGYEDEFAFVNITFDPDYDTPDVLIEYSEDRGAAPEEDNWCLLRPETEEEAEEIVQDEFGIWYEYMPEEEREEQGMHPDMAYPHDEAIILANKDGYVERTYFGDQGPSEATLLEDIETLRDRW